MNEAARSVLLKAVVQLEVERHLLIQKSTALAAESRDCEDRIVGIAKERSDILSVTGVLSPEERVMIASARDIATPRSDKTAPTPRAVTRRKRTPAAGERRPPFDDLQIIGAAYSVAS